MLVSIVGMTVLLGSLLYFHLDLSRDYLKDHLSTHNRILAVVLRNSVLNDQLVVALRDDPDSLPPDLRDRLDKQLGKELRWVPIVKVKIYSADSTVVYSTKKEEIGLDASGNLGVLHALHGEPLSDLVRRNQRNELDGSIDEIDLHQQYIPIKDRANDRVVGVFEIYTDVSGILQNAGAKQRMVFWSIAGILGIFYLALTRAFVHAHRALQDERRQREAHLEELTEIKEDLEQRVEQRTAELDKSKNFLQAVIDGIGNPLFVIRSDFTIALMNRAASRLIPEGADPEDHRYCYQISHRRDVPCDDPDHPCSFAQVMNHGRPARARHTHYDANNQPMIIDLLSTPLYSEDGTFEGVIEVEHDVTQMVQMQAGLVESEARLQAIMDHVPDAILTCDPDCVIKSVNSSALRMFNGSEDDLVGQAVMGFMDRPDGKCLHPAGETMQMEVQMRRIDSSYFPADVWIGPLDPEGETRYVAVVRDISARRQAQEELEKTRQQYFHQEKMAAIGHLAAGILHEVGNPIAAIAGAASELKTVNVGGQRQSGECPHDDVVSRNIDLIDTQATRLGKITREIADFASPRPRERELLDLNSLLRSTASLLAYDRRFRDVQLKLHLDHDLPAIFGVADQLTQVFMNLLINAMDACGACGVSDPRILIISAYENERVRVSVQDNGCGMSEETVSKVMEPFYTTKPVGKGTGLGLSLCDSIALSHGGSLEIESQEGQGTTVHLFLPLSTPEDDVAELGGMH
jgi:PAS domain S-box-containing protein